MGFAADDPSLKRYYLGIDDTDNLVSRGTGFRARELGSLIEEAGLGKLVGITRHQLLVDPSIPYTSHNSSACLELLANADTITKISDLAENYLLENSADGSDAGICIMESSSVDHEVMEFGRSAKEIVVDKKTAIRAGNGRAIAHKGLTGDHGGLIGAIAAVGLRASGNDGRFIWSRNVRELSGTHTAEELINKTGIEVITTLDGCTLQKGEKIDVEPWPRPVLLNNKATLIVEKTKEMGNDGWRIIGKEYIKKF